MYASPWPRRDRVRRLADRLEAGRAVARDGRAVRLERQSLGEEGDDPAHVEALEALRESDSAVDLLDQLGSTCSLRSSSASMTKAPISSGRSWASDPLKARPMGVRTASTITGSGGTRKSAHAEDGIRRAPSSLIVSPFSIGSRRSGVQQGVLLGPAQAGQDADTWAPSASRASSGRPARAGCRTAPARSCTRGCRVARGRAPPGAEAHHAALRRRVAVWPIWPSKAAIEAVITTAPRSPPSSGSPPPWRQPTAAAR